MILNGHEFEYYEDEHLYVVDGIIVPSITQLLAMKFGGKYAGVSKEVLAKAAAAGTRVHQAIEMYAKTGEKADLPEMRGFEFLKRAYGFEVVDSEVPVIVSYQNIPIAAGRLDLVLKMNGELGGADIKRTAVLDKEYLAYQLNLYRIGYQQTYGKDWTFLRGIHLRNDTRKFVNIPINEQMIYEFLEEYIDEQSEPDWQNDQQYRSEEYTVGQSGCEFYPCSR